MHTNTKEQEIERIRQYHEQREKESGGLFHYVQSPEQVYEMRKDWEDYLNNLPPTRKFLSSVFVRSEPLFHMDLKSDKKIKILEDYFSPIFDEYLYKDLERIKGYKRENKRQQELYGFMYGLHEVYGSDVNLFPQNFVERYPEKDGIRMNYFGTYTISYCPETEDLIMMRRVL